MKIYAHDRIGVSILKVRIAINNRGKSSGLRVYCLVIRLYRKIILLGVTAHQKRQHNLTEAARKMLKELCDKMAAEIEKEV